MGAVVMAKKKRKKRPQPKPPPEGQQRSARAERKELARKEREAAIRRVKRRRLLRRVGVWALVLAVAGAITAFVLVRRQNQQEQLAIAEAAAERFGCEPAQEDLPNEGNQHIDPGQTPPSYGTTPATSGPHTSGALPADVYDEPIPEPPTVHSLEHGYVGIYYRAEAGQDLQPVVDALTDRFDGEAEIILAPYQGLPDGVDLAFVAWQTLQHCAAEGDPEDAVLAAEGFVQRYLNGPNAPEAEVR